METLSPEQRDSAGFANHIQSSVLSAHGTVAEAIRTVAMAHQLMGFPDPQKRPGDNQHNLLLTSVLHRQSKSDSPPH
jgi:predicted RecB family nuclease